MQPLFKILKTIVVLVNYKCKSFINSTRGMNRQAEIFHVKMCSIFSFQSHLAAIIRSQPDSVRCLTIPNGIKNSKRDFVHRVLPTDG